MKNHTYYVYILTSERNGIFYTGITNDLIRRVYEHKEGALSSFTKKYNVKTLVYYECFNNINDAIYREKLIKKWKRKFKVDAIERMNPLWKDLYFDLINIPDPATSAG